jgi:hypothetical protein
MRSSGSRLILNMVEAGLVRAGLAQTALMEQTRC